MKQFTHRIIHILKKFTVFDWIICAVLLGILGFFLINRSLKDTRWVHVRLKVSNDDWWWQAQGPQTWYGSGLSAGQFSYNSFGQKTGEILSVENYDIGGPQRLMFVSLNLFTTYNKRLRTYTFDYQTLQVGKPLDFTFGTYNLHGLVTYIGNNSVPYSTTSMEVKIVNINPWEAESYTEGLQMKDLEGNIVGTIEKADVTDSVMSQIRDVSGRLIVFPLINDARKDVTLRISIKTTMVNATPYFLDGSAIKIGNHIWLEFEHTAIKDAIISQVL